MTVKNTLDNFLSWKASYLKSTVAYKTALKPLYTLYGEQEIESLTLDQISKLIKMLDERYARATVYYFTSVLKMFVRYLYFERIKTVSPELIKSRRQPLPITRAYVTREDLIRLCATQDPHTFLGVRNIAIMNMLYNSGARISELLALTIEDLGDGQTSEALLETKKNGIPRYILWSKGTHRLLQTYVGLRIIRNYRTSKLFINKKGAILTARGAQYLVEQARIRAGITKKITCHSFRHGKAHEMLKNGANIKEIGVVLGHSENNPRSAMQYLHLDGGESLAIGRRFV